MIDMTTTMNDYYFWLILSWTFSGIVAFGAGFLTCFFFCNYKVVKVGEEVTTDG